MGKSTTAQMLRDVHVPVFDADAYVHRALRRGGRAVDGVAAAFPRSYDRAAQRIDRRELSMLVFHDKTARKRLEGILHPLVRQAEIKFIKRHRAAQARLIVLDIPLLFETGAEQLCDAVICVRAPDKIQAARVLRRPGMTAEKFAHILKVQMPSAEKCARADFVLQTGGGHDATRRDLQDILRRVKQKYARNRS